MRTFVSGLVILLCSVMAVPRVAAQQPQSHAAPSAAIDQALQQHVTAVDADRAVVQRLLARPDVQSLAKEIGLDVRRAQSAVATLDATQLSELASHARQAEQGLAGGQSVRISTTLIIIALLVLILLIVAID